MVIKSNCIWDYVVCRIIERVKTHHTCDSSLNNCAAMNIKVERRKFYCHKKMTMQNNLPGRKINVYSY